MSEFKIVKCPKCDAGLVQLEGEKLKSCVQCGHSFTFGGKKTKRSYSIQSRTSTYKNSNNKVKNLEKAPSFSEFVEQLKQISEKKSSNQTTTRSSQTTTSSKKSKITPKKKSSFSIGTIIFWIIVINIVRSFMK